MIDRSEDFERLFEGVVNRDNIVLSGDAGMGKSYLVEQLVQRLSGRRFCFEINLRGIQSSHELLYTLLNHINDAAEESYNLKYQLKRILDERPVPLEVDHDGFIGWLKDLLVGLQNVSLDFLFVFEDVDQWEGKKSLVPALEHFLSARNSQALVTTANHIDQLAGYTHFRLSPLKIEDLRLSDDSQSERVERMLQLTGGNTAFFLELMAQDRSQSPNQALNAVLEKYHALFYNFRHRFTALQWKLLLAIASEGSVMHPHAFEFLINYRLGAASSVERALRNLSDTGIIKQKEAGWQVADVRFGRWLVKLYPQFQGVTQN